MEDIVNDFIQRLNDADFKYIFSAINLDTEVSIDAINGTTDTLALCIFRLCVAANSKELADAIILAAKTAKEKMETEESVNDELDDIYGNLDL